MDVGRGGKQPFTVEVHKIYDTTCVQIPVRIIVDMVSEIIHLNNYHSSQLEGGSDGVFHSIEEGRYNAKIRRIQTMDRDEAVDDGHSLGWKSLVHGYVEDKRSEHIVHQPIVRSGFTWKCIIVEVHKRGEHLKEQNCIDQLEALWW